MSTLAYIVIFTFLGSIGGLIGGIVLLLNSKAVLKFSHFLASFAAGTLLGAAFFDLLPEALREGKDTNIDVLSWTVTGIAIFFLIERFMHAFHHHDKHHDDKEIKITVPLIIVSDTVHNFIDGVVIAATFLVNIHLGIVTTFAVFAHELPQEIGDFGLLLHKGLARGKIILVNIFSASVAFVGALTTFTLGNVVENYIPVFLGLTAGFFIYIATSDLIPEIHYEKRKIHASIQVMLFILGIVLISLTTKLIEP